MRIGYLLSLWFFAANAQAWDGCKFERELDQVLDLGAADLLTVKAAAGNLRVDGVEGGREARIGGRICASKDDWLADMSVHTEAGARALIAADIPRFSGSMSWGNDYAYIDLVLEVPTDVPLEIQDSSGDMELRNLGKVTVMDSSGDIDLVKARGSVVVEDSSGSIRVEDLVGDLEIVTDSSGDVRGLDIDGSVTVMRDSSGDLHFSHVSGSVLVERDSSGDISVSDVGGDFTVLRDGSGSIRSSGVKGKTSIPD